MNAVEIEEAVGALADRPFDAAEFPFAFLVACIRGGTSFGATILAEQGAMFAGCGPVYARHCLWDYRALY